MWSSQRTPQFSSGRHVSYDNWQAPTLVELVWHWVLFHPVPACRPLERSRIIERFCGLWLTEGNTCLPAVQSGSFPGRMSSLSPSLFFFLPETGWLADWLSDWRDQCSRTVFTGDQPRSHMTPVYVLPCLHAASQLIPSNATKAASVWQKWLYVRGGCSVTIHCPGAFDMSASLSTSTQASNISRVHEGALSGQYGQFQISKTSDNNRKQFVLTVRKTTACLECISTCWLVFLFASPILTKRSNKPHLNQSPVLEKFHL